MSDPNTTSTNDTVIQRLVGVPNEQVATRVPLLQADPRYISHRVIAENGDTSTIEVTLRRAS